MVSRSLFLLLACAVACGDSRPHVFQAPPPPTPVTARVKPAATPLTAVAEPEVPIGSLGPEAQIISVADAATGIPISLTSIGASIRVMALVACGPAGYPTGANVALEITMKGPTDTTIAFYPGSAPSVIIAHAFELTVARGSQPGLKAGGYTAHLRLMVNEKQRVISAPLYFTVN